MMQNKSTLRDGLKYRPNKNATWLTDSMCLTAADARQVVAEYRRNYSATRCAWLLDQAYQSTPFADCAEVFNEAKAYSSLRKVR